jgi:DNA-binding NtrC family response regulator
MRNGMNEKKRILIVEDDPGIAHLLEYILLDEEFEVSTTNNANDALKYVNECKGSYDLIITCICLPGEMNGLEMSSIIKQRYSKIPIIVCVGLTHYYIEALKSGIVDKVIQKPFLLKDLIKAVQKLTTDLTTSPIQ